MSIPNKKPLPPKPPLTLAEIIMRADVETIRAALEARQRIDGLLAERAAAYERIAALEHQVDEIMGAPGLFVFPAPAVAVAAFTAPAAPATPAAPKPTAAAAPAPVAAEPVHAAPSAPAAKPADPVAPASPAADATASAAGQQPNRRNQK